VRVAAAYQVINGARIPQARLSWHEPTLELSARPVKSDPPFLRSDPALELRQRDLKQLSTSQLYSLSASLRRQIERETGPIRMVTPTNAIPKEEYVEEIQEWNP
jgi:hypothetical protein